MRNEGYINKQKYSNTMWPFKKTPQPIETPKKNDTEYVAQWKNDMLLRWIDLEARVTALEMVDKEYKKRVRTKITGDESKDSNNSVLIPV